MALSRCLLILSWQDLMISTSCMPQHNTDTHSSFWWRWLKSALFKPMTLNEKRDLWIIPLWGSSPHYHGPGQWTSASLCDRDTLGIPVDKSILQVRWRSSSNQQRSANTDWYTDPCKESVFCVGHKHWAISQTVLCSEIKCIVASENRYNGQQNQTGNLIYGCPYGYFINLNQALENTTGVGILRV